jgi:hypothetical protein
MVGIGSELYLRAVRGRRYGVLESRR